MNKLLSGRFILTVVCAVVFGYCAVTMILPTDSTVSIITMVFVAYFNRADRKDKTGGEQK